MPVQKTVWHTAPNFERRNKTALWTTEERESGSFLPPILPKPWEFPHLVKYVEGVLWVYDAEQAYLIKP